jgi:hypothetical protein
VHCFAQILIDNGPDHAGTVAELWPNGELPQVVASKPNDAVWCETLGEYMIVGAAGRDKVTVRPARGLF